MDRGTIESLLDAMEGVAYFVNRDGEVSAVGRRSWRAFSQDNGAPALGDTVSVLGRPLLNFIHGSEVRQSYEAFIATLRSGRRQSLSFEFSCDSPEIRRRMRMCISSVAAGREVVGFLFQSLILEERTRPPVSLFDAEVIAGAYAAKRNWPLLRLCSYCQRVATNADAAEPEWISAEGYYRRGGGSQVRISHGICADCMRERVEPLLS
jgi:hypothetical protein